MRASEPPDEFRQATESVTWRKIFQPVKSHASTGAPGYSFGYPLYLDAAAAALR